MKAVLETTALRALVVEDVASEAAGLLELLGSRHHLAGSIVVNSLEKALTAIGDERFDLILLDLGLPDAQGNQALETLRPLCPDATIIVVSGRDDEETMRAAAAAGADDFLVKGLVDGKTLAKSVLYALSRRQALTAQRAAAEARVEMEVRLREIVESSTNVFFAHQPSGEMLYISPQVEEVFGYTPEEVEGHWTEHLTDHAANRAGMEATERAVEAGEPCPPYELQFHHADGREVWVEVREAPVVEAGEVVRMVGSMTDVTERKRTEAELSEIRERLGHIVSHAPAVFYTSLAGDEFGATYVSRQMEKQFGWEPELFIGERSAWIDRVHPEDLPGALEAVEGLMANGHTSACHEYRFRHADGSWRWVRDEMCKLESGPDGRPEIIGFLVDTTSRKQLEEQLRQAQKMEAVGRLAGGVAHDFNNLLTAITGYTDLASSQLPEGSPVREDLDEVRRASERAGSLTRQLLAFSRRQVLQPRALDLNVTVRDMLRMLDRVIGEDVRLVTRLEEDLHPVEMDPGQLEQVILNLAVNARDAMSGGGTLKIETQRMELPEEMDAGAAVIPAGTYSVLSVADTGVGMDRETRERIFEPFFTTKRKGEGTGLGLSTVYGIVKQSGGFVFVYSEAGEGTVFRIYLPEAEADVAVEGASAAEPGNPERGSETVLVVDDNAGVRTLVARALGAQGYRILEAASGSEALDACREHGAAIDLILCDVVMPDMRGPEVGRQARELAGNARFLFVSGYSDFDPEEGRGPSRRNENTDIVAKPFTPSEIASRVREILDRGEPRS